MRTMMNVNELEMMDWMLVHKWYFGHENALDETAA